jgi:hypothetical protein
MNAAEVENVFGSLSSIHTHEKHESWAPILILVAIVGIGVTIMLNQEPKVKYREEAI